MKSSVWDSLVDFDIFPKVDKDFKQRTATGGFVSLFTGSVMLLLFLSQLRAYLSVYPIYEYLVDPSLDGNLLIHLDMSIAIDCEFLTIQMSDASGEGLHSGTQFNMMPTQFEITADAVSKDKDQDVGQLVHDAMVIRHQEDAYLPRLLPWKGEDNEHSGFARGCRVYGQLAANKVSGTIQITASGHGFFGLHTPHELMNFTHRVDRLQFGVDYPGIQNPLDGIVPTIYVDRYGHVIITSQYAVTEFQQDFEVESVRDARPPGIFFKYDLDPISVRITETGMPFLSFLVKSFGILGGIWVTVHMVYRYMDALHDFRHRRPEYTALKQK